MDANSTTPLLPEVVDAMSPFWTEHFANPSSVHQPGQRARAALDQAREAVASLLLCRPSEVVFTSGGTESNNLANAASLPTSLCSSATATARMDSAAISGRRDGRHFVRDLRGHRGECNGNHVHSGLALVAVDAPE